MKDLFSLQALFDRKIFRIPDYQRGYSWTELQLSEFWSDLYNLLNDKDHYTGMVSLKKISKDVTSSWDSERWLFNNGYEAYHIVDGQQRLTTIIILINEIVDYYRNKYKDKSLDTIYLNSISISRIVEDYLYIVDPSSNNINKSFKFGYEVDNPSYEFFKHKILGEPNEGELKETYYTLNLLKAKEYFKNRITDLVSKKGEDELEVLFRKLTQKLKFNIYYIDDDFNVFIAFETMNNRGKPLSYLELLKNRLIYLSTLFDVDDSSKNIVRSEINETWKTVYSYLGRNKEFPLDDNEFLQNHWMIYFKYTRTNGLAYKTFLLDEYFTQQSIFKDAISSYVSKIEVNNDVFDENDLVVVENDTDPYINKYDLKISDINNYILSLKNLVKYWYQMHFPDNIGNTEIKQILTNLKILGYGNFKPLITVLLSKNSISDDKKIDVLKGIERFVFLHYRLNNYSGTFKNSFFYGLAHKLYFDDVNIDDVIKEVNDIEYLSQNNVIVTNGVVDKFERMFTNGNKGFYSWATLRYVLYQYENKLMFGKGAVRLLPEDIFKTDKRDTCSIEHIFPQTPTEESWVNLFDSYSKEEQFRLNGSLGNLLPLSKSINSAFQNDSFEDKKNGKNRKDEDGVPRGYNNGSYNELEVARCSEWTPQNILERGLKIVNFMEDRWNFKFKNREEKIKFLGLSFMVKEDDINIDYIEPIMKEKIVEVKEYNAVNDELFLEMDGITYANGFFKDGGIVVKKGSKIRTGIVAADETMQNKVDRERRSPDIENGIFIEDHFYLNPSLAAVVVLGNHKNGWTNWKNGLGITLDELARGAKSGVDKFLKNVSTEINETFKILNERLLDINSDIETVITNDYIGYKANKNFLELHIGKNNLTCYTVNGDLYKDNSSLIHIPESYGWRVDTKFIITTPDDIDKYWDVIIDSYNNSR